MVFIMLLVLRHLDNLADRTLSLRAGDSSGNADLRYQRSCGGRAVYRQTRARITIGRTIARWANRKQYKFNTNKITHKSNYHFGTKY